MSSWTTHESDLTLYADFEVVGVSPGEPGSPGSAEGQEYHSRCRTSDDWSTDERVVYGMGARQVNTGQWIRGFAFISFTSLVVSKVTGYGRNWLMVFHVQMEGFLSRGHSFLDPD